MPRRYGRTTEDSHLTPTWGAHALAGRPGALVRFIVQTPRPGLAPGSFRLTGGRSALELARNVEDRRGWTCTNNPCVPDAVLTLLSCTAKRSKIGVTGVAPAASASRTQRSTVELHPERTDRAGESCTRTRPEDAGLPDQRDDQASLQLGRTDRRGLAPQPLAGPHRFRDEAGKLLQLTIQCCRRRESHPLALPHEGRPALYVAGQMPKPGVAPGPPPYQGGALLSSHMGGEGTQGMASGGVAPASARCERAVLLLN